ncbi:hypothetical protein F4861DRAFT_514120 [Xylaria intraflava]|nr:hypothetical protein F4861DRAFT_514120 [Xylaria intraflava]
MMSRPETETETDPDAAGDEQKAFLEAAAPDDAVWSREGPRRRKGRGAMWYFRLMVEIAMVVAIALLSTQVLRDRERVEEMRSPVPRFPRKTYTFRPDPTFVRDDMLFSEQGTMEALHNWLPLSSEARGYVQIPDHETYDILEEPYTVPLDRVKDGPAYMMSVFHQLHCLSYVVDHYRQGYAGANLTDEVAHHSAHCFDYLRQSIMCAGDTNLEGKTADGPGWGSRHVCVDYDALLSWANERATMKWRTGLLPGSAIL